MKIEKFTNKSIEAVNMTEELALEYGNQELTRFKFNGY